MNNTTTVSLSKIASEMSRVLTAEVGASVEAKLAPGAPHDFVAIVNDEASLGRLLAFLETGGFTVMSVERDVWANEPDFAGCPPEHWVFVKHPARRAA